MVKLNAKELRLTQGQEAEDAIESVKRRPIYFILENIYDTYNIGGLFRLADALAVKKIYLCGQTEIPPNPKIKKASIGTYKVVPWEYRESAAEVIAELKSQKSRLRPDPDRDYDGQAEDRSPKIQIIAIEQSENSVPYTELEYNFPAAFIVGNETYGVLPETLALADKIVVIPMWGVNKSLNVIVSAAIVTYHSSYIKSP